MTKARLLPKFALWRVNLDERAATLLTNIEHLAADRAAFVMVLLQLLLLQPVTNPN